MREIDTLKHYITTERIVSANISVYCDVALITLIEIERTIENHKPSNGCHELEMGGCRVVKKNEAFIDVIG